MLPAVIPSTLPVLKGIGWGIGGLMTADAVDTVIGSPIKRLLGIQHGGMDRHEAKKLEKKQKKQEKKQRDEQYARGLLAFLNGIAAHSPTYLRDNRGKLARQYQNMHDNYNADLKDTVTLARRVRRPLGRKPKQQLRQGHRHVVKTPMKSLSERRGKRDY